MVRPATIPSRSGMWPRKAKPPELLAGQERVGLDHLGTDVLEADRGLDDRYIESLAKPVQHHSAGQRPDQMPAQSPLLEQVHGEQCHHLELGDEAAGLVDDAHPVRSRRRWRCRGRIPLPPSSPWPRACTSRWARGACRRSRGSDPRAARPPLSCRRRPQPGSGPSQTRTSARGGCATRRRAAAADRRDGPPAGGSPGPDPPPAPCRSPAPPRTGRPAHPPRVPAECASPAAPPPRGRRNRRSRACT